MVETVSDAADPFIPPELIVNARCLRHSIPRRVTFDEGPVVRPHLDRERAGRLSQDIRDFRRRDGRVRQHDEYFL